MGIPPVRQRPKFPSSQAKDRKPHTQVCGLCRRPRSMQAYTWRITMAASFSCLLTTIGCLVYVFAFGQTRLAAGRVPIAATTDHNPTEKVEVVGSVAPGPFCTTPNGENATCRAWYDCQILVASVTFGGNASRVFAEASKCGETPLVCCGSTGSFLEPEPTPPPVEDKLDLLPSAKYCGLQHTDDYFYDKNETSLDEFPWLAYIHFENSSISAWYPGAKEVRCTGFLINPRYVITARFCGSGADPITKVHLGRYNRHENVSCVKNDQLGFDECTETSLEVKVTESVFPDVDSVYVNDIRLLRLEKPVSYSDYVRPICLPLNEATRAKPGDEVVASGWGARRYNESAGVVKKRLKFALRSIEEEGDGTTQMYAVPKLANKSTCLGDDGGPLMFSYKHQWFAEGVINADATPCDEDPDLDAAASRITPLTIEWILDTLRP